LFGHEAAARAVAARSGGLWGSLKSAAASAVGLGAAERQAAEQDEVVRQESLAALRQLRWVPVRTHPLELYLPCRGSAAGGGHGAEAPNAAAAATAAAGALAAVAAPCAVRPAADMWLASHAYLCLAPSCGALASRDVLHGLGWAAPLPPLLAAAQLRGVAHRYEALVRSSHRGRSEGSISAEGAAAAAASASTASTAADYDDDDDDDADASAAPGSDRQGGAAEVAALQRKLAAAVPKLYACLDGLTSRGDVAAVREVLGGARWLWVGTQFVTADQVRARGEGIRWAGVEEVAVQ
jgi:hypothetical protein